MYPVPLILKVLEIIFLCGQHIICLFERVFNHLGYPNDFLSPTLSGRINVCSAFALRGASIIKVKKSRKVYIFL
jgi:hypothetical protein